MNIIVIAPHHDDEVIGCGGSIALHTARGDTVTVVYVTQGWSGIPTIPDRDTAMCQIKAESAMACHILGVTHTVECGLNDRHFGITSETIEQFVRVCREVKPSVIYIPNKHDGDHEHRLVYDMISQAVWQAASPYLPEFGPPMPLPNLMLGYEVWHPMATYQMSVDITAVMERKVDALRCYRSQLVHRDWTGAINGMAAYRGATSGAGTMAEVYQVIRCRNMFSQKP